MFLLIYKTISAIFYWRLIQLLIKWLQLLSINVKYVIAYNNIRRRWRGYSASTNKRQQQQTSSYNRHMHR